MKQKKNHKKMLKFFKKKKSKPIKTYKNKDKYSTNNNQ